ETDAHGPNYPGQPPELLPEDTEYEVEEILDSRKPDDRRIPIEYYIRWADYPESEDSWEPKSNVENAKEAIAEFYKKHPAAYQEPEKRRSKRNKGVPGENTS
ncbi:hypothetical protein PQX77_019294, partial [Marasmius sp. AFHP31]